MLVTLFSPNTTPRSKLAQGNKKSAKELLKQNLEAVKKVFGTTGFKELVKVFNGLQEKYGDLIVSCNPKTASINLIVPNTRFTAAELESVLDKVDLTHLNIGLEDAVSNSSFILNINHKKPYSSSFGPTLSIKGLEKAPD